MMATAETGAAKRRPWPGWLEWLLRFEFTRKDVVIGGWFATCAPLFFFALNPWNVLSHAPKGLFVGCDFIALAAAVYAAGLCLTRWRNPPTLWLALAFSGFSVFVFETLAGLTVSPDTASSLTWGLWWVIPLTVAAWTESGLAIARGAPLKGARAWQTVLRSGKPRDWKRVRPFLTAVGVEPDKQWALPRVNILLWTAAIALAIMGSIPDVFFSAAKATGQDWRGAASPTRGWYLLFVVFATVALTAPICLLLSGVSSVDRRRIKQDDFERLRWAPWAASMIFVLVSGAEMAISFVSGSESLFDVAMASSALLFALVALNAAAYSNADLLFSSPLRRLAVGAGWFAGASIIVLSLPVDNLRRGGILGGLMFALPMLPAAIRGIEGLPRIVIRPANPDQAKLLRTVMGAPDADDLRRELGELPSAAKLAETLGGLGVGQALPDSWISANELVALLGAHKGSKHDPDFREEARLARFVGTFAPLECVGGDLGDRHVILVRLIEETARVLARGQLGGRHPSGLMLVRVVCLAKTAPVDERGRQRELTEEEERLLLAYEVWALGDRGREPALDFAKAYRMTLNELQAEREKRTQRVDLWKPIHLPPPSGSQLNAYQQLYPAAVAAVFERWVRMLTRVETLLRDERLKQE